MPTGPGHMMLISPPATILSMTSVGISTVRAGAPVLAELYTSQDCARCPAADEPLSRWGMRAFRSSSCSSNRSSSSSPRRFMKTLYKAIFPELHRRVHRARVIADCPERG